MVGRKKRKEQFRVSEFNQQIERRENGCYKRGRCAGNFPERRNTLFWKPINVKDADMLEGSREEQLK